MRFDFWNKHTRWRLANSKKHKGTLVKGKEFIDHLLDNFAGVGVYLPLQIDTKGQLSAYTEILRMRATNKS